MLVVLGLSGVLGVRSRAATADGDAGTRVEWSTRRCSGSSAELEEAARKRGIGDLGTVAWGILESDGTFSFVEEHDPAGDDQTSPGEGQHDT